MQTVTKATPTNRSGVNRRQWLECVACLTSLPRGTALVAGGSVVLPGRAAAAPGTCLAAAWGLEAAYQVGLLARKGPMLEVLSALEVPTRAHGLWQEPGGTFLAVARRPGDWLLRWHPDGRALAWAWIEPDRAFNGHVVGSGQRLFTSETDLETGQGLIGVRDAASLEKLAEWPTHGMDPHTLLRDTDGSLWVANGGIPALPETGRLKLDLSRMDSSLVHLHGDQGRLLGQWRVPDPRLSLRHMAWGHNTKGRVLGIALQAEHADAALKHNAPVLALWEGQGLRTVAAPQPLAGYGGDIAFYAAPGLPHRQVGGEVAGVFAVSCPRTHGVALYNSAGGWQGFVPLGEACALAPAGPAAPTLWVGGAAQVLVMTGNGHGRDVDRPNTPKSVRLDNHWLAI